MAIECQGKCEEHGHILLRCEVRDIRNGKDYGLFTYCYNAIDRDRAAGLDVSPIEWTEHHNEPDGQCNDE